MSSERHSNSQLVIDALCNYANLTGVDLSTNPFAENLQRCKSPDGILELLQEREKAFKEYRDGNRRLIKSISPAVRILHAFSSFLSEATSLVRYYYIFHVLLQDGVCILIPPCNPTRPPFNLQKLSL